MQEIHVPGAHGATAHVRKDQHVTLVDLEGSQVIDFIAFAEGNLEEFLSVTHTQVHLKRFLIGKGDLLVSNLRRPLLQIVRDDCGRHDMHYAMCDPERYLVYFGVRDHRSCMGNFLEAYEAAGVKLRRAQLPNPVNINQNVAHSEKGDMELQPSLSKPGSHVVLRALTDLHVGVSACPMDLGPINGGKSTDVLLRVSDTEDEAYR